MKKETLQQQADNLGISKQAVWAKTKKGKAYQKAYQKTPKYKAYKKAYKKAYHNLIKKALKEYRENHSNEKD